MLLESFLARLERPFAILGGPDAVAWAKANPRGLLVVILDEKAGPMTWRPEATFPYRGKTITVWDATTIIGSDGRVMGDRY